MNGRETLQLLDFSGGTVSNADPKDIPDNAASYSSNVDGDASNGKIIGIPDNTEYKSSAYADDTVRGAWIARTSTWDFVYDDGTNIKAINDWYSTFAADAGISVAYRGYSCVPRNQEVHIGCGTSNAAQWVGKIDHGVMNESAPTNLYLSNATLPKASWSGDPFLTTGDFYISNVTAHTGSAAAFDQLMSYTYAISIEYDYMQETTLSIGTNVLAGGNVDYIQVSIKCSNGSSSPTSINKRITAIKLYRRETPLTMNFNGLLQITASAGESTLYRLIKRLPTNGLTQTGFSWIVSGGDYVASHNGSDAFIKDDNTIMGATYEQESGIAETLTSSDMKYTVSCDCNGYLFVGGCSKTEVPDAVNMIFRSKAYRFDTFDWSHVGEFVNLHSKPLAMANFNGRVWVFSANDIYRINPDTMVIEDVTTGIGCYSQRSIIVTDYGMFWCDANGAYWHDGSSISKISDPIQSPTGAWHGLGNAGYTAGSQDGAPIVQFWQRKNYVIFAVPNAGDKVNCWSFHVLKKRWDYWPNMALCGANTGMFTGKNGDIYLSNGTVLYSLFSSANTKPVTWTTKDFDYGNVRQRKRLYGIISTGTGTPTINYYIDGGSAVNNATTPMTKMNAYRTKFQFSCAATYYLDSVTVNFRRLHLDA